MNEDYQMIHLVNTKHLLFLLDIYPSIVWMGIIFPIQFVLVFSYMYPCFHSNKNLYWFPHAL